MNLVAMVARLWCTPVHEWACASCCPPRCAPPCCACCPLQLPGGYLTSILGGRRVLPAGVALWSAATCAVPALAGTLSGAKCAGMQQHATSLGGSDARPSCWAVVKTGQPVDWSVGLLVKQVDMLLIR
jgi:hypothetical protein